MTTLLIDTSSEDLLIGLTQEDQSFLEIKTPHQNKLSEMLLPSIQNLLLQNGLKIQDVTEVGVGIGPGSYTGTRVGVAVAKSLSFALKIPLFSFCSLLTWIPQAIQGPFTCILPGKGDLSYVLEGIHANQQLIALQTGFLSHKECAERFSSVISPSPLFPRALPPQKGLFLAKKSLKYSQSTNCEVVYF